MEKECSQCHRIFRPSHEGVDVCPDCLRNEFKTAAPSLDAEEHQALVAEYESADKRQAQRAVSMKEGYLGGTLFSWAGKLRFAFGIGLFVLCALAFMVLGGNKQEMAFSSLDLLGQRVISLFVCLVAAALIASSTRRFPFIVWPLAVIVLACGWYLPDQWKVDEQPTAVAEEETEEAAEEAAESLAEVSEQNRALNKSDLDIFYQQKNSAPNTAHYAVYMDKQDSRTRSIVREALTRLLGAEYTRAYNRNDGALYVVSNVRGKVKNISRILSRFGHVTYSSPSEGIYEVRFEPDRANMVSRYPVEVLADSSNSSYVSASIAELSCLESMRIRAAAKNLYNSNVQMLRNEVREALLTVLQDPWNSDFDTYSALAEALSVYARPENDTQAIEACRQFFRSGLAQKREIPEPVTRYLVREVPDEMVEPIVEFWCENPIAWSEVMSQLGTRTQKPLLEKLRKADNIRSIGTIIRYLKDYGDAGAIDDVKPFLNHQDSIIRHTAQDTLRALESRQ